MFAAFDTPEVILALAPAVFGLLGTLLGAGIAYRAKIEERHAAEDDKARNQLVNVSAAIHRASWLSKFGASQPDDMNPGPGGLGDDLRTSVKEGTGSSPERRRPVQSGLCRARADGKACSPARKPVDAC